MDINALKQLEPMVWTIADATQNLQDKIRFYGSKPLMETMDEKVLEQISNVAQLPGLVGPAMTMPDAHWGYGFPIGGVAAFDPKRGGIISAGGVGFDISCGIRCLRTNLFADDILPHAEALANILFRAIPAGVGRGGHLKVTETQMNDILTHGALWAVQKGYGQKSDLEFVEEHGQMAGALPENVSLKAKQRQLREMGSLGSGNHYLEIQVVDKIYDAEAATAFGLQEGQVIISIHCGSRGLGHQIGTDYLISLAKKAQQLGIHLPDRELACAPIETPEGQQYLGAMRAGINCALANRQILTHLTREAVNQVIPTADLTTLYDVSHNTCKEETHLVDGKPQAVFIHRKGATRAFGPGHPAIPARYQSVGQPVIIGGSMGTRSYVLAGNPPEQNPAFASASHGAGRAMSRHQALKHWRGAELMRELEERGIYIRSGSLRGVAEEAPKAYKDVDLVAEATERAGLARRVVSVKPKVCVKG